MNWFQYPITQYWNVPGNSGYNPNNATEYGVDLATPMDTPITSISGGTVYSANYQPWGGQIGIHTYIPGLGVVNEYIQHLDQIASGIVPGAAVTPGELLGYSGGQTSGGSHPTSSQYSSGPHTEFGFGAPWNGGGANFNPLSILQQAQGGQSVGSNSGVSSGISGSTTAYNGGPLGNNGISLGVLGGILNWLLNGGIDWGSITTSTILVIVGIGIALIAFNKFLTPQEKQYS